MINLSNTIIHAVQAGITACDIVRSDSVAYRSVVTLLHNQIFDLIEWGCNKPDFFKITKNYTASSLATLDRFENVTKLLTLSPAVKFFDGSYDQSSSFYRAGRAVLLLSDIKTGVEFIRGRQWVATAHLNTVSNGLFAIDSFFRWYAPADTRTPTQIESLKRKALSYTADFALGVLVAAGASNQPLLGMAGVASLGFKVYSVVFDKKHEKAVKELRPTARKPLLGAFIGQFYDYIQKSESHVEAKDKVVKLVYKIVSLVAVLAGSISNLWRQYAAQAQQTDKLTEAFDLAGPAKRLFVPTKKGYLLSSGETHEVVGVVALFSLRALSLFCFGEALGFYKLNLSSCRIGQLPVVGLAMGLLGTAMTAALIVGTKKFLKTEATKKEHKVPLSLYARWGKSVAMTLSFAVMLAGIDSVRARTAILALNVGVDALGYASALQS